MSLFSSAVAQSVETTWHRHAALQILRQIEEPPQKSDSRSGSN
ncbi:hypothetical protein [Streptomyces chattanoogensis]